MRRSTLVAAAFFLLAAALWHLPTAALRAAEPEPAAPELITFDQYRDFRAHDLTQRQARLAQQLAAPDLSATEKASIERRKAYYDKLAAMPAEERDRLFRARFDQIDTNHDGKLDQDERAQWRDKQREHYRQLAVDRAHTTGDQR